MASMERPIHFKNKQGEKITGTLHLPDAATDRGVVLSHCFTCSRHTSILRQLGHDLAEAGLMALRFDFSGNGQSEGDFSHSTYTKQISETKIACDVISSHGASLIGLAGHSMGAVIALLTAVKMKTTKAVCTIAGRLSGMNAMRFLNRDQRHELDHTGQVAFTSRGRPLTLTQDFFSDADRFDLLEMLPSLKIPLLIVHGDRDEIIPVNEAHTAHGFNPDKSELAIVAGADHMFSNKSHREEVSRQIVTWFENQI
jgi:putative redox protein